MRVTEQRYLIGKAFFEGAPRSDLRLSLPVSQYKRPILIFTSDPPDSLATSHTLLRVRPAGPKSDAPPLVAHFLRSIHAVYKLNDAAPILSL